MFRFFLNYFKGLRHEDYLSNVPLKVLWCFLLSLRYTSEGPGLMKASELALEKLWGMSSDVQSIFMPLITKLGGETSTPVDACISGSSLVSHTSLLPISTIWLPLLHGSSGSFFKMISLSCHGNASPSTNFYVTRPYSALFRCVAQLWNATASFIMSVCLFVLPSVCNNSAPTGRIFIKFDI